MIVKDEAHVIERCLNSVKPLIDEVVIVDTGSTDDTIKVINNFLKRENLAGKITETTWQGFAHGRSLALEEARKTNCDYSLMIDADEVLKFKNNFNVEKFKESLSFDIYDIPTNMVGTIYYRPTLTCNKREFKYKGVVHEFLDGGDFQTRGCIDHETQFYNHPIQDSTRNKNPRKFQDDAKLLKEALETEKDDFLRSRYTFYAAQSHKDCNELGKALDLYLQRMEMGHWEEESYQSCLKAGTIQEQLGYPEEIIISTYLRGLEFNNSRAEAYHYVAKYCRLNGRNHLAYLMSKQGLTKKIKRHFLFTEKWIYDYGIQDEFSIAAYWAGHYGESYEHCKQLLQNPLLPKEQLQRIQSNLKFAKDKL
jgi:glycosyltransferase involved in cell wall biosynthesis